MKNSKIMKFFRKKSPEVLIFFGISGFLSSTVLAVKATPKAMKAIDEAEEEKGEKLTVVETVKTAGKYYIPCVGAAIGGVICVLGANGIHNRRNAAIASAFSITDTAYSKYKEKTREVLGETKEKVIEDKLAKDAVDEVPFEEGNIVGTPSDGRSLCYDMGSSKYFYMNIEDVRKVENDINAALLNEMFIYLNELYDGWGIPETGTGDLVGFDIEKENPVKFRHSTITKPIFNKELLIEEEVPVFVIDYNLYPKPEWMGNY